MTTMTEKLYEKQSKEIPRFKAKYGNYSGV